MKKRPLYSAAWIVLTSALLFNQVGLHFFHDKHDAHELFEATQKNEPLLLNHGEHCQVCSLEVLFNILLPVPTEIAQQVFVTDFFQKAYPEAVFAFVVLCDGRAPPTIG